MKTKVIKWMNLFLVLAVLFGYQWIALGNQKKRDDYKQLKMENEKKLPTKWKNGVYYGEAEGFGGPVKLKVIIQSNKIKSITVISAKQETKEYWNMAATLLDDIIKKQSAEVDVVSGATYSSRGIINATKQALEEANEKNNNRSAAGIVRAAYRLRAQHLYPAGKGKSGSVAAL